MRIESTGSATANVTSSHVAQTAASAAASASKATASTSPPIDPATGDPVPPKYPWITRLSLELEKNAQKTSPFESAKIVGETLDKLA